MGLFDLIFGRHPKDNTAAPQWPTLTSYSSASWRPWSGNAYESDLVRAAVDARARHISKLSIVTQGSANPALQRRLRNGPNQWQTWSQFLYRLSTILDMQCTAFIVPVYDGNLAVTGVSIAIPQSFELVEVMGTPWLRMHFANGNTASDELTNIGVLTKYQYLSDYFGTNNSALADTLALIDIQRQGIQEAAKNSATYRFMATLGNFASEADLKKERERFSAENFGASANGGGVLLFPNTYKDPKELSRSQYAVDAAQLRVIQDSVYCYFGVNEKIMSNSANADELDAFYEGAVEPFALQLADVLTRMLFTTKEQMYGNRIQFSADRLAYMSTQNKINLIQQMSDRGQLTINEARRILNLPELPNGDITIIRGEYRQDGQIEQTEPAPAGEGDNNG